MAASRRPLKPSVAFVAIAFLLAAWVHSHHRSAVDQTNFHHNLDIDHDDAPGNQYGTAGLDAYHRGLPPGCSLPSDHDAIAWLASASTSVSIVTAYPNPQATSEVPTLFKVDRALEITGSPWQPIPEAPFPFPALTPGRQFLVFSSTWRGGLCVSTLYSYDPNSRRPRCWRRGVTRYPPGRAAVLGP